jgi:hypothetical protein
MLEREEPTMDLPDMPEVSEEELRKLPRWARVAFAARCGRRAQPLLRRFWQNPHPPLLAAFDRAVELAERSAAQAGPAEGLPQALAGGRALRPGNGRRR